MDDIFADRFQEKMSGLGYPGVFRADRHHERARLLDDARRPPVGVRLSIAHGRRRIEERVA